jgi:hypothetical protein
MEKLLAEKAGRAIFAVLKNDTGGRREGFELCESQSSLNVLCVYPGK